MKTTSLKSSKIDIFAKGHGFDPKLAIFPTVFFFCNLGQENVFYNILKWKTAFYAIKTRSSKNWHFCKGVNPWFWSKKGHFSNLFFLANLGHWNIFYDILEQKNAYLGYKSNKFKKLKNWHFSEGVNLWFSFKNGHFCNFFFLAI